MHWGSKIKNIMKTITILFSFFFLFTFNTTFAQNFWSNTSLTAGFAFSNQDRRLFEFPNQEEIIAAEDSKRDYEYNLSLQKSIIQSNLLQIDVGIGYNESKFTFSRPFDHGVFYKGLPTNELRFIKRYTINKLILPISNNFYLTKKQSIFLSLNIVPAIAFRKSAKGFSKKEIKWDLELNSLELYPGLGVKLNKRMWVTAQYRWLYINKLDEVIFNYLLFYQRDPAFLRKKYDDYNPFKLWFTVSYALGE